MSPSPEPHSLTRPVPYKVSEVFVKSGVRVMLEVGWLNPVTIRKCRGYNDLVAARDWPVSPPVWL